MSIGKTPLAAKSYWDMLISEVTSRDQKKAKEKNRLSERGIAYEIQNARRSIKYQLGEPLAGVYFTQREADCMMQMLNGKTMSEAGETLQLSPRTVEYYLSKVKQKLKCRKKREMINLVSKTEFANNFRRDPFNKDKDK